MTFQEWIGSASKEDKAAFWNKAHSSPFEAAKYGWDAAMKQNQQNTENISDAMYQRYLPFWDDIVKAMAGWNTAIEQQNKPTPVDEWRWVDDKLGDATLTDCYLTEDEAADCGYVERINSTKRPYKNRLYGD